MLLIFNFGSFDNNGELFMVNWAEKVPKSQSGKRGA